MLQAGSERPLPAGSLWVPGMSTQQAGAYAYPLPSARAQEIARRRDEMLGMLHGLPESEYELSLTDLVERTAGAGGGSASVALPMPLPPPPSPPPSERKEAGQPSPIPLVRPAGAGAGLSESGRQPEQPALASKRGASRRRGDSGSGSGRSSFRSSSDGVLLNFYMPSVISRSFTAPRAAARTPPPCVSAAIVAHDECNKRERDCDTVKCWPSMRWEWDRRWRRSGRRDLAGESAAILQDPASEDKVGCL